jgi:hypothetical protein
MTNAFDDNQRLFQAETYEVLNQPGPLTPYNPWRCDRALQHWFRTFNAGWAEARLDDYGARCGGCFGGKIRPVAGSPVSGLSFTGGTIQVWGVPGVTG